MNEYILKGEKFLQDCLFDGLAHSYNAVSRVYNKPYPEVTGYVIKYFCDNYGADEAMISAGKKLLKLQDESGGFPSFYSEHILFAFDTAQILNGFCSLYTETRDNAFYKAAVKAGDFIISLQLENGAIVPIFDRHYKEAVISKETYEIWAGPFSAINCKSVECMNSLYKMTGNERYSDIGRKIVSFYRNAKVIEHSHPLGYLLEGLYECEEKSLVDSLLKEHVIVRLFPNGYIPYTVQLPYAYVSGTIQLGIILYKMGYVKEAEQIRNYARCVQSNDSSGGLFQYADKDGNLDYHVHTEINSWGTKYFCELERLLEDA
jgi:uncharacterized protein YyaL (SSP411 family)